MTKTVAVTALSILALGCAPKEETPQQKYRDAYRSIRRLDAAISVGVSYADLGSLVRDATAEVAMAADLPATPEEQVMVGSYRAAAETYNDSLKLWKAIIDTPDSRIEELKEWILLDDSMVALADKYALKPQAKTFYGRAWNVLPREGALQAIWAKASEKAAGGHKEYLGLGEEAVKSFTATATLLLAAPPDEPNVLP